MKIFSLVKTIEYTEWLDTVDDKHRAQIENRLSRVECEGHFGHLSNLGEGLAELKFNIGI